MSNFEQLFRKLISDYDINYLDIIKSIEDCTDNETQVNIIEALCSYNDIDVEDLCFNQKRFVEQ